MSKLTIKQKRFADEYILSGNATEAAIRAGYAEKNANRIGSENLSKLDIKNYIDERLKALEDAKIADIKEVLELTTAHARGEIKEEVVVMVGEMGGRTTPRIVKKQVAPRERLKALEMLLKRYDAAGVSTPEGDDGFISALDGTSVEVWGNEE